MSQLTSIKVWAILVFFPALALYLMNTVTVIHQLIYFFNKVNI